MTYRHCSWVMGCSFLLAVLAVMAGSTNTRILSQVEHVGPPRANKSLRRPAPVTSLVLSGEIVGIDTVAAGTLTVRIDGKSHGVIAASPGSFEIEISGDTRTGMVSLHYEQEGVRYESLLGTYAHLARLSRGDQRLTIAECDCLRVSPLTTGLKLLAERALGEVPMSEVQLARAVRAIRGDELATAVLVLVRLADDTVLLPAGYADGLALLENREAFTQYRNANEWVYLEDPATALDSLPAMPFAEADIKPLTALLGSQTDPRSPVFGHAGIIERDEDAHNTYRIHEGILEPDLTYTGAVDAAGRFVLQPDRDLVFEDHFGRSCPSDGQYTLRLQKVLKREFRRHWLGNGVAFWQGLVETESTFPDCPELETEIHRNATMVAVPDLRRTIALTNVRRFLGLRALPMFCNTADPGFGQCEYALHHFNAGGVGTMRDLGYKVDASLLPAIGGGEMPFTWAMQPDASMRVDYGDTNVRYWILDGGDAAHHGLIYVAETADGGVTHTLGGYTSMIRASTSDFYDVVSPVGTWSYAWFDLRIVSQLLEDFTRETRFIRDETGRSVQWNGTSPGVHESWQLHSDRLYTTMMSDTSSHVCDEDDEWCRPETVRYFRPLARVGNRLYGIEDLYYNVGDTFQPPFEILRGTSRPTYHQLH